MSKRSANQLDYQAPSIHEKRLQGWWIDRLAGLVFTYIGLAIVLGLLVIAVWAAIETIMYYPRNDFPFTNEAIGFATVAVIGMAYLVSLGLSIRRLCEERARKRILSLEMEQLTPASDPDTQSTLSHPPSDR